MVTHLNDPQHPPLTRLLHSAPIRTLKLQGMLSPNTPAPERILVDDADTPRAVLLKTGPFHALHAADTDAADALLDTLDWTAPLAFAGLHDTWLPLIQARAPLAGTNPCVQYHLSPQAPQRDALDALWAEARSHIGPLRAEHAPLVNTHWPYGDTDNPDSIARVARRIAHNLSRAWFSDDHHPIAWAMLHDDLSMGFMHTLAAHRRRGVGIAVAAALVSATLDAGHTPYAHVVATNRDPDSLIARLGLTPSEGRYLWLATDPASGA